MIVFAVRVPLLSAQIYRYLGVSTVVERQQTKWLVFGYTATELGFAGLALVGQLVPSLNAVGHLRLRYR